MCIRGIWALVNMHIPRLITDLWNQNLGRGLKFCIFTCNSGYFDAHWSLRIIALGDAQLQKQRCSICHHKQKTSILRSSWEGEGSSLKRIAGGVKTSNWEACGLSFTYISKETVRKNLFVVGKSRSGGMAYPTVLMPPSQPASQKILHSLELKPPNGSSCLPTCSRSKSCPHHAGHVLRLTLFFLTIFFHFILRFWYQVFTCSWVSPRDWARSNLEAQDTKEGLGRWER